METNIIENKYIRMLERKIEELELNLFDAERYLSIEQERANFFEELCKSIAAKYGENLETIDYFKADTDTILN